MTRFADKRKVTDEEFRRAMALPDVSNLIRSFQVKYRSVLDEDERSQCAYHALWRTLQDHCEGRGNKMTSSLYRFLGWEFDREANRKKKRLSKLIQAAIPLEEMPASEETRGLEQKIADRSYLECRLRHLPKTQRQIITSHFFEGVPLSTLGMKLGLSKDSLRNQIAKGLEHLREVCEGDPR